VLDDLPLIDRGARLADHRGDQLLAEAGMRNAKRGRFPDPFERLEHTVDLYRRDLFAATVDDFLDAPGDIDVPIFIRMTQITGAKPVADKRPGV
jgi:hypothetical protein